MLLLPSLDQEFNSLDAQYDASSAHVKSQVHADWTLIKARYDDGGYSGGSTERPDLQRLLEDIRARKIDVIVSPYGADACDQGWHPLSLLRVAAMPAWRGQDGKSRIGYPRSCNCCQRLPVEAADREKPGAHRAPG